MNQSLYLVAGLGKTGFSIARYLLRKNRPFLVFDTRKEVPGLEEFYTQFPEVPVYLEDVPSQIMDKVTDIISSPGVDLELPFFKNYSKKGIPVYGDIECFAREVSAPVVAITGTNGKSTVTTLVGEMAQAAGLRVAVAGNIGTPVLDMLDDGHQYDLWVLELSSFQLDLTSSLSPEIAVILNISPDHLDRHQSLAAYIQAKQRIYHNAKQILFNREDDNTLPLESMHGQSSSFGRDAPALDQWGLIRKEQHIYLAQGETIFLSVDSLLIKGAHNWLNALCACALAQACGISMQHMAEVLTRFTGLSHRCQWVRRLNEVDWINDSKGTNVGATLSAIHGIGEAIPGKIVLIAGGQGKGADFRDLRPTVNQCVRSVILIGEDAELIRTALSDLVPTLKVDSLAQAIDAARAQAVSGDTVLLSPACASFDMFVDFNDRGTVFTSLVNSLAS